MGFSLTMDVTEATGHGQDQLKGEFCKVEAQR